MICYKQECIFVHIPKTGGTSIEDVIWGSDHSSRTEKQLWMGAVRPGFNKYQSGGLQHLLATQIRQEVGQSVFDRFWKFAFVRNPWDRVVSQYCYMKKRKDLRRHSGMRRWTSLKKYLRLIQKVEHVQWYEQWRFILDKDGHRLVDFIGRFENLQQDFQSVMTRLGRPNEKLPHTMKSQRTHYSDYYDQESLDTVAQMYQRDIELLGYSYASSG